VPDNTIYRLAAGLGRLEAYHFPAQLTATTRAGFERMAVLEPGPDSADMKAVAQTPMVAAAAERLSQNPRYNAQLRTTCVPTLISGGQAENALPQRARATIQCRMMPGDSAANVEATLQRILNDPKISLRQDAPPIVSPESPPTPALMAQVTTVVQSMWPGVEIVPRMSGGFSDGRQTRNAGIPTYELGGTWSDVGEARAHGRDERISIQAFDEGVEYTYRLVKALSLAR
jgi:acetylornithine deacetylase/succinyl-diaminopimelate desuccinylase-like protein